MRSLVSIAISPVSVPVPGWHAELTLGFSERDGRTTLSRREHSGPLRVQRPFYPEPQVCHVYILHPPGGIVGGDTLQIKVLAGGRAQVLLTTPAANKFYRSKIGTAARLHQSLTVEAGASLEWFPQEAIVFDGACVASTTRVEVAQGGHFMGWEITCLGRRAAQETYMRGEYRQHFEIWREGRPLWIERACVMGGGAVLNAAWGLAGFSVTGSFVCITKNSGAVQAIRDAVAQVSPSQNDDDFFSVTQLDEVLICRYLGHSAERARHYFIRAWEVLRPLVLERTACAPRIWVT